MESSELVSWIALIFSLLSLIVTVRNYNREKAKDLEAEVIRYMTTGIGTDQYSKQIKEFVHRGIKIERLKVLLVKAIEGDGTRAYSVAERIANENILKAFPKE